MLKSAIALLCGLLALNLCGAWAESMSCPLKDPPSQCGGYCLGVLMPVLNHLNIPHNLANSSKANEVIVRQYTMEGQLTALKDKQLSTEVALDAQGRKLDINEQNFTDRLNGLESILSALEETVINLETKMKYFRFEQIGSKYYYIEKVSEKNWSDASKTCRNMGGHLADIQDEADLNAIKANLQRDTHYWLGINDLKYKGEFLSMSTGKSAPFLKWGSGGPSQLDTFNCVFLYNGEMHNYPCKYNFQFICQTEE
ncbi:accessory gland protein Acp29AB [Drosophila mauritiana]|uniref:Accessory gland protein Acp29AB n=1 Tax=Drosophila mauritiana TaxID=7226 RepID=A0A6P8KXT9_DROMA|nr:accessory gland protein Acp29AB [Drosophila mauritiana]